MRANAMGMVVAVAELEGRAVEAGKSRRGDADGVGMYGDAAPRTLRRHGPDGNK